MKKLLLLLLSLLSSAACAMEEMPTPVAMSEDTPSFISKEQHKKCCGCCGASAGVLVSGCFVYGCVTSLQNHYQKCGDWRGCNFYEQNNTQKLFKPLNAVGVIASPAVVGYWIGEGMGAKTFELDKRLHALLKKEKSE